jgi:hypothetical protein
MAVLSGTVTFLFTDIEGSTRLWEQHPDAMDAALQRHVVDGLPAEFPPLRTGAAEASVRVANPTNLTKSVSSFVGRDAEVAEVAKLLEDNFLVTLIGSGGVGKTRLAIEAGRILLPETADGVWLVEMAKVRDSGLVARRSCATSASPSGGQRGPRHPGGGAGLPEPAGDPGQLRAGPRRRCHCGRRHRAQLPGLTLLLTSREPLRIEGEVIYRVPSLSLPPEHVDDRTDLAGSGAVALFVERASTQAPDFVLILW